MKQQILVIHGGDVYTTYNEFIDSLKNTIITIDMLRADDWKRNLKFDLRDDFDVLYPWMPSIRNAKYLEWKIMFSKMMEVVDDNIILVGHSLGGIFIVKYLSEEKISKRVKATFLVSAPYDSDGGRKLVEFTIPDSLELLEKQGGKIYLYHSKDDPVVKFTELTKFQEKLPNAKFTILDNRGHFNQPHFPEIISDITALSI